MSATRPWSVRLPSWISARLGVDGAAPLLRLWSLTPTGPILAMPLDRHIRLIIVPELMAIIIGPICVLDGGGDGVPKDTKKPAREFCPVLSTGSDSEKEQFTRMGDPAWRRLGASDGHWSHLGGRSRTSLRGGSGAPCCWNFDIDCKSIARAELPSPPTPSSRRHENPCCSIPHLWCRYLQSLERQIRIR